MNVRVVLLVALLSALAPNSRADETAGIILARQARTALDEGRLDDALELLARARLEWPDSDYVRHGLADTHAAKGDVGAALVEFQKARSGDHAFRARFNSGALMSAATESELSAAGVPLTVSDVPEDADPGPLITAIDEALPKLAGAREEFAESLALQSDRAARESVAALTERMEELLQMRDELQKRQDEQEEQQDGEGDEQNEDQEQNPDEQEPQDQDPQDQGQDQQDPQGQDSPPEEQDGEGKDEPPPEDGAQPQAPQDVSPLTAAERKELLDKLEQLEAQALALERERRARERVAVEKDW